MHDHTEYQDDQPEQRAEHDQCAHARISSAQTFSLTLTTYRYSRYLGAPYPTTRWPLARAIITG